MALGFGVLAAVTSAAGAWLLSDSFGPIIVVVAVALSILCVLYERSALMWIAARRGRKDLRVARWGIALLIIAAFYTAGMQLTYFGSLMLRPASKDAAAAVSVDNIKHRITDLEARRAWLPPITATPESLREEIAGLERDAGQKGANMREAAKAAAAALPSKRAALSAAERHEALDREMVAARKQLEEASERPPSDIKAEIFGAWGKTYNYIAVFGAVLLIQLGQILLPAIAGKAEIAAVMAERAVIDAGAREAQVLESKPTPPPALPAPSTITTKPMQLGPMALAALKRAEEQRAQAQVLEAKPAPKPATKAKAKTKAKV